MVSTSSSITIAAIMISLYAVLGSQTITQAALAKSCCTHGVELAPVLVTGANVYTAWNNASTTSHGFPIFFTKSTNGGKTFANTMIISSPNKNPKVFVINQNISISASGNNVAVTWWTNKTGTFNPVIRTSSDGGNTFSNIIRLNSTSGGINK